MRYVFLHGLGQSPDCWKPVADALGVDGLCPDLFRLLEGRPASWENLYRVFVRWRGELREPVRLCGLSLGGVLALQYAAECPEGVRDLVLIGAQCVMPKNLLRFQNAVFRLLPERAFRPMGLGKREVLRLTGSMASLDLREDLGRIGCPALVLCGERDRANQSAARMIAAGIPQAGLAWIPGAGHEANRDAPEELAGLLKRFWGLRE